MTAEEWRVVIGFLRIVIYTALITGAVLRAITAPNKWPRIVNLAFAAWLLVPWLNAVASAGVIVIAYAWRAPIDTYATIAVAIFAATSWTAMLRGRTK